MCTIILFVYYLKYNNPSQHYDCSLEGLSKKFTTMLITYFISELQLPTFWQYFLYDSNTSVCHTWISCHPCADLMSSCLDTLLLSVPSSSSHIWTFLWLILALLLVCLDYFGAWMFNCTHHKPDIPCLICCLSFEIQIVVGKKRIRITLVPSCHSSLW